MSICGPCKVTDWQTVMHLFRGMPSATLAPLASPSEGTITRCIPSDPIAARRPALPTGVSRADVVLRLPLGHAGTRAEQPVAVKVGCWATEILTTPLATLRRAITSTRIRLTLLPLNTALHGAQLLRALACTRRWLATDQAGALHWFTPPCPQLAGWRAICLGLLRAPTVLGMIRLPATFAIARYCHVLHTRIISQQERYCEIAARRLSQQVLHLEEV